MRRLKVLSLGGGLDSWAMLLDAEIRGELPDVVAFVDVGDPDDRDTHPGEWDGTYRHIEEVVRPWCRVRGVEFVEISARTGYLIRPDNQGARSLFGWLWTMGQIPVAGPNRICTRIAKVERFERWLDKRFAGQEVETWIGFDAAEQGRVDNDPNSGKVRGAAGLKARAGSTIAVQLHNAFRWTKALAWAMTHAGRVNRFPLMERGLCRCRCEALARASGYAVPRKSSCQACPYGSRGDWKTLAVERPVVFAYAVELEARKAPTAKRGIKLSIMEFNSKTKTGTPLPKFVAKPYKPKIVPCTVCGAAQRATKASGCGYLDEGTQVAA
jgi:hypothetical protein